MNRPGTCGCPGGGGSGVTYTFSDGLTKDGSNNVTNDLVTGATVAHLNVVTTAGSALALDDAGAGTLAAAAELNITGANNVLLQSTTQNLTVQANAAGKLLHLLGAVTTLEADGGNLTLTSAGNLYGNAINAAAYSSGGKTTIQSTGGASDVEVDAGRDFLVNSARQILLVGNGNATLTTGVSSGVLQLTGADAVSLTSLTDMTITTNGPHDMNINASRDELHTVGRNFGLSAAGSTGVSISADHHVILAAGGTGTGEVRLTPTGGAPAPTQTFRIWNGAGASQQDGTALIPSGGGTVDVEARTALGVFATYLFNLGWVSNPTP